MPSFDILPLFSAGRSRKLTLVPIVQSLAQLKKNYGRKGAEIITDNCQDSAVSLTRYDLDAGAEKDLRQVVLYLDNNEAGIKAAERLVAIELCAILDDSPGRIHVRV